MAQSAGENNPLYGIKKTPSTLAKITKLVFVYNFSDMALRAIGEFSTVNCSKHYKMGRCAPLTKYLKNGLHFKGKIFSRKKLH